MVPLYFALEYYWNKLNPGSILSLRLLSVLLSLVTGILLYLLGASFYGRNAGIIATLFYAFSRAHIYYSQEIRMYPLYFLLVLLSVYAFRKWLTKKRGPWGIINVIANGLLLSTHIMSCLLLVVEALTLLAFHWRETRKVLIWGGAHLAMVVPFIIWISQIRFQNLEAHTSWITTPHWGRLLFAYFTMPLEAPISARDPFLKSPISENWILILLCSAALLWLAVREYRIGSRESDSRATRAPVEDFVLLVSWFLLPAFMLFVFSHMITPSFVERYTFHSSFALYILLGGALASSLSSRWLTLVALILVGNYCTIQIQAPRPFRMDFWGAGAYLESHVEPGDKVFSWRRLSIRPLRYYCESAPCQEVSLINDKERMVNEIVTSASTGHRTWAVVFPDDDLNISVYEESLERHNLSFEREVFSAIQPLYVYQVRTLDTDQP